MRYKIYILNGKRILSQINKSEQNKEITTLLEFVLKKTILRQKFALLHQINNVVPAEADYPEFFLDKILYIDFSNCSASLKECGKALFENGFNLKYSITDSNGTKTEKSVHFVPFEKSNSQAKNCIISFIDKNLFYKVKERIDLGFDFNDYKKQYFTDTTNINKAINIPAKSLSKLYAYRGLCCSDATRIEEVSPLLNEKHTIVIDGLEIYSFSDETEKNEHKKWVITMPKPDSTKTKKELIDSAITEKIVYPGDVFDGEGICSPLAAAYINYSLYYNEFSEFINLLNNYTKEQQISEIARIYNDICLNKNFHEIYTGFLCDKTHLKAESTEIILEKLIKNAAFSFQIRLPFGKGMLHTISFHSFFNTYFKGDNKSRKIKDVYGVNRELSDVHIILTKSMFKLHSLGYNKKNEAVSNLSDPMKEYFDRVRKYDHALYVIKTEKNVTTKSESPLMKLSYQILNTLKLSHEEFDKLIENHIKIGEKLIPDTLNNKIKNTTTLSSDIPYNKLLKANPDFLYDTYIQKHLADTRTALYYEILDGNIRVQGENRFLSRDLLEFLRDIANENKYEAKKGTFKIIKENSVKQGEILIPDFNYSEGKCAVFRSPHLSRNENVAAEIMSLDGKHIATTYLCHLKGLAMVGAKSHIPTALGGADFDGDTVNICVSKPIVNSCFSDLGGYFEKPIDDKNHSLPLIEIPSLEPKTNDTEAEKPDYIDFNTIISTFDNRTGHISNNCLKLAAVEYGFNEADEKQKDEFLSKFETILLKAHPNYQGSENESQQEDEDNCNAVKTVETDYRSIIALGCILVGLEIDSCKTGLKPHIEEFDPADFELGNKKDKLTAVKNYLSQPNELKGKHIIEIKPKDEVLVVSFKNAEEAVTYDKNTPFIAQLPYKWAEAMKRETAIKANSKKAPIYSYSSEITPEQKKRVKDIFKAYDKISNRISDINRKQTEIAQETHTAKAVNLLREQYDEDSNILAIGFEALKNALLSKKPDEIREILSKHFSVDDINNFWPYKECRTVSPKTESEAEVLLKAFFNIDEQAHNEKLKNSLQLLLSFNAQGYLVFYHLLKEFDLITELDELINKTFQNTNADNKKNTDDANEYVEKYYNLIKSELKSNTTVSFLTNARLLPCCKKDLEKVFTENPVHPENKSTDMICEIYDICNIGKTGNELFWKLFTEEQLVTAFSKDRGETNA